MTYIKNMFFNTKEEPSVKEDDLMKQIRNIKVEIDTTRTNLDLVTDECLIDSYIYELTALNKRYQYFLQQAKQNGLRAFKLE